MTEIVTAATPRPDEPASREQARSLWTDAWDIMRRRPIFWIAMVLIVVFVLMAVWPALFRADNPLLPNMCLLERARQAPGVGGSAFGFDSQGCSIYDQTIYGARASILVGIITTIVASVFGAILGTIAGYLEGWVDAVLSRIADVFFALPLLLGAIVIMTALPTPSSPSTGNYWLSIFRVVLAMALLGWPYPFRIMRSAVIQVKPNEYVLAARALGASPLRMVTSHVVPNSLSPVIVVATNDLGSYIATEATLSFLGVGLPSWIVSWGGSISNASSLGLIRQAPFMLLFPSLFLCLTILSFIMLGEVVRDALDPKLR
ncbi:MAG: ABC transporter permease [Propionibacteriaceae bacterium]|nr:ABC transporter permease [Propionibacteriaceae bacterium]